jgi:hypothetical protein
MLFLRTPSAPRKTAAVAAAAWLTPLAPCAMFRGEPTKSPARGSCRRHVWGGAPLIVAAAILLSIAGVVLFLHDLSEARSRKAFDRIFEEVAGGAAERPGFTAAGRTGGCSAASARPGGIRPVRGAG